MVPSTNVCVHAVLKSPSNALSAVPSDAVAVPVTRFWLRKLMVYVSTVPTGQGTVGMRS